MKYRKYKMVLAGVMLLVTMGLVGCAGGQVRSPDSVEDQQYDGNEPQQRVRHLDTTWLNGVDETFGKVAARSSNRSLASQDKEILLKKKGWNFFYQKSSNQFFLSLDGQSYRMIQTDLGEAGNFQFAAEGVTDNPPTLTIHGLGGNRGLASASQCNVDVGYFNKSQSTYAQKKVSMNSKSCAGLAKRLKDYVP